MKAVRGGWVISYRKRISVSVRAEHPHASPEVFESKLNCRFRKFESVLTVYSAGIAGCKLNASFRTLFVAGLAKISVEFRSELGSNGCQTCAGEIITSRRTHDGRGVLQTARYATDIHARACHTRRTHTRTRTQSLSLIHI